MLICVGCQTTIKNLKQRNSKVTNEQSMLYLAFKHRGVAAELEHQVFYDTEDTNKKITLDIAVPNAKLYIEVNRMQHAHDFKQQIKDLRRTHYYFLNVFFAVVLK
ncbi:MAG: hypothetical protein ACRC3G_03330 [Bacteroidales bacterium]